MKKIINTLKQPYMGIAWIYAFIHFCNEVICFFALMQLTDSELAFWLVAFIYDALAFLPQSIIGALADRFPKLPVGPIGVGLLLGGFIPLCLGAGVVLPLVLMSLGNACIHVAGAEVTLRISAGKLSHSAVFVGGGAIGVITGRLLGNGTLFGAVSFWWCLIPAALMLILMLMIAGMATVKEGGKANCESFRYHNEKLPDGTIILLAALVVVVRSYMGFTLPTAWNKTTTDAVLLYFAMGLGKMLGGIFSDSFGIRKTAIISIAIALPFILFGNSIAAVSLIGILLFSMTMPVSLGTLCSVLPDNPGIAFGITTVGLFLGTVPLFFFNLSKLTESFANNIIITVLSALCLLICLYTLSKKENEQ